MPVKTIQFIYTMHNKILTIGGQYTQIQNYDMINNQIIKVYLKPNSTVVTN